MTPPTVSRDGPGLLVDGLHGSEYDRGRARGHVEAYGIILGGIRRGQFSPEVAGEVHRDGTVVEVGE
jgi:hypothetical protein